MASQQLSYAQGASETICQTIGARFGDLEGIRVAYLRLKTPVAYDAADGRPVSDILVVLVPKQAAEEHLRILADAARMFADRAFREHLRRCRDASEAKRAFDAWA